MEPTSEARFEDALNGAIEEAVQEVDTVEGDDDVEIEDVTEEEPVSEQDSEDIVEDEVTETDDEAVDDQQEDELEQVAEATFEQTGNPDDLPPELVKSYRLMQAGFSKKMQQLANERKVMQQQQQQLNQLISQQQESAKKAAITERPANPTESMSVEEQNKRWQEITTWDTESAIRKMIESGQLPDPERVNKQLDEQEASADGQTRANMIASQEGFTEEIGSGIMALAAENPYWEAQIRTDDGAMECFKLVKSQLEAAQVKTEAAQLENARVKRSAGANKRATPKPGTQTKKAVKPAENFAELGFEGTLDKIIGEDFGL